MPLAKTVAAKAVLTAALLAVGSLLSAPNALADVTATFGVNASGSVSGAIFQNCGGNTPGSTSATFNCATAAGSVTASIDFGAVSITAETDNIQADSVGSVILFVQGTVGGTSSSGTMTWTDTGISATPGADVFLTIYTQGGPYGQFSTVLGSTCFEDGINLAGCGTATSMNANAQVFNGQPIELLLQANCGVSGRNGFPAQCTLNDPLSLSLSDGLTFNSDVPNLFSPGPSSTPEPSTLLLLGSGVLSVPWLVKRFSILRRS